MGLLDTIRENYPQWAWAINDPELGPLLKQAVDPKQPFSPTRFNAKVMATGWWRKRSAAQREWEMLRHSDPGTANQQRGDFRVSLQNLAKSMGVHLSANEMIWMTEAYLGKGMSPDDPQVLQALGRMYAQKKGKGGQFGAAEQQVRKLARDYMVNVTPHWAQTYGRRMVVGMADENSIREELSRKAMSRYPHLKADLAAGVSMRELFDGHIATIAEELELDPDRVNLMDAKWNKVLDKVDTSGKHRPMSLSETMTLARSDSRFWNTSKGKELGAGLSTYLLQAFGKR